MEELLKKYEHLDDATKRKIKTFVSSKGLTASNNSVHYKQNLENLENQIDAMLKENAI